jgi:hypothetical protein
MDYRNFNPCTDPTCVECARTYYRNPNPKSAPVETFSPGSVVRCRIATWPHQAVQKGGLYVVSSTVWLDNGRAEYLALEHVCGPWPADYFSTASVVK